MDQWLSFEHRLHVHSTRNLGTRPMEIRRRGEFASMHNVKLRLHSLKHIHILPTQQLKHDGYTYIQIKHNRIRYLALGCSAISIISYCAVCTPTLSA